MNNVNLVFATSANGVIGSNGKLPWHIPEDLARFRRLTEGGVVVMGHSTWDSLPDNVKPLPNRTNIVLSTDTSLEIPGVDVRHCIEDVMWAHSSSGKTVWVIGGTKVLEAAAVYASMMFITSIKANYKGDTFAPKIDLGLWDLIDHSDELKSSNGIRYHNLTYTKTGVLT
jgi:dihydrofolate reductase